MRFSLLLLAGFAAAAPVQGPKEDKMRPETALVTPAPVQWLKSYSLSPYKEHWSMDLEVKDYDKDTDKVVKVFQKAGASLTQPLDLFPASAGEKTRQLSFRASLKSAQGLLKPLNKAVTVKELRQRPAAEPISLSELDAKIDKLSVDRRDHEAELAKMPAVSAVVEELLAHLLSVRAVQTRSDSEVLINVTIRAKR